MPALAQPSFEAATLKPAEQVMGWIVPEKTSNPVRVTYRNYNLKKLIMESYQVARYQVEGPAWMERERYDIVANTPRGASAAQERLMMQSLLAERFHLALHTEKKDLPAFVLLAGKDTAKLRPVKDPANVPACAPFGTLSQYADWLSTILDKPVVNQTGVAGTYYFFHVIVRDLGPPEPGGPLSGGAPGAAPPPPPPAPPPPPCPGSKAGPMPAGATTDANAVKEQMGLRLERRANLAVNVLVVDHADKTPVKN